VIGARDARTACHRSRAAGSGSSRTARARGVTNLDAVSKERAGLLGLAFHPVKTNRRFYVNYTTGAATRRPGAGLTTNPDPSRPPGRTILDPAALRNHNGDDRFGRDGYLYIGMGTAAVRRPGNRAQSVACWARCSGSTSTAHLDAELPVLEHEPVRRQAGRDEICARPAEPVAASVRPPTGNLWIGEASRYEECRPRRPHDGGPGKASTGLAGDGGNHCYRSPGCSTRQDVAGRVQHFAGGARLRVSLRGGGDRGPRAGTSTRHAAARQGRAPGRVAGDAREVAVDGAHDQRFGETTPASCTCASTAVYKIVASRGPSQRAGHRPREGPQRSLRRLRRPRLGRRR
jgi:hypothetical protein